MMDLRLLGIGNMQTPFSTLQKRLFPWQMLGMTLSAITGFILVFGDPMRFYANIFFWIKMYVLPIALIYTITVRRMVSQADEGRVNPGVQKIVGLVSILLWFGGVAIPSRLIGLFT